MIENFYRKFIFPFPKTIIFIVGLITIVFFTFSLKLEIDASSETLLLEGDKDLKFTREVGNQFETQDFLIVTYTVEDDLLSDINLQNIRTLSSKLLEIPKIESVTNITNVPLLESPIIPISELIKKVPTLKDKDINKTLVRKEFLNSPLYKENLVSEDFKTTAFLLNLKIDDEYNNFLENRNKYLNLARSRELTKDEKKKYQNAQVKLKNYRDVQRNENHRIIEEIRKVLRNFEEVSGTTLHLGGVAMIADDMVEFVKNDLRTFGIIIIFIVLTVLYIIFRELKWVFIPLIISAIAIIITSGFFAIFSWEITVISSNFISLQLIMNISLIVHLIVKYHEISLENGNKKENIIRTMMAMARPSFFVVITTIAGFSSLVFSGILPIITFGWMMSIGIVISLMCTFLLFPIFVILVNEQNNPSSMINESKQPYTVHLAYFALNFRNSIFVITFLFVIFSLTGALGLRVENSFIDYFKSSTEIYKGMSLIDKKLGGTTPLDIIVTFQNDSDEVADLNIVNNANNLLDEFNDEFSITKEDKIKYWFTEAKMARIKTIHEYLAKQEGIGKVLSLNTLGEVGKKLNNGKDLDSLTLALMYQELPQKYRSIILSPYVNVESNRVRISARIIDSKKDLQRDKLIKKINKDLRTIINPKHETYRLSNLLVIYNNMLQSLFDSQIKTIGVVIGIIFIMFMLLFRDFKIASIAIIANSVPVGVIFGVMGWLGIPLDLMTITIAAISIGIAVDNTIHYIHRFLEERKQYNYYDSVIRAHRNIGKAMFYTSLIIIIGFCVLMLSNFIPTIYFGVLTMLAMFMAIVSDLLLLPALLYFYQTALEKDNKNKNVRIL